MQAERSFSLALFRRCRLNRLQFPGFTFPEELAHRAASETVSSKSAPSAPSADILKTTALTYAA